MGRVKAKSVSAVAEPMSSISITQVAKQQQELLLELAVRRAEKDVLYWMTDMTKTEDKQVKHGDQSLVFDSAEELIVKRPFPRKEYFKYVLAVLKREPKVAIWKSRTMMMSWFVAAYVAHLAFTRPATEIVVQSADEVKAFEFIDKVKVLWQNSHERLKAKWPVDKEPYKQPDGEFTLTNRSRFVGLACGVLGPHKIRSFHPTVYVADEAAFMPELDACIASALGARTMQIILISSAAPGPMAEMWEDAVEEIWPDRLLEDVRGMEIAQ